MMQLKTQSQEMQQEPLCKVSRMGVIIPEENIKWGKNRDADNIL